MCQMFSYSLADFSFAINGTNVILFGVLKARLSELMRPSEDPALQNTPGSSSTASGPLLGRPRQTAELRLDLAGGKL